jgi:hypothetical protein
MTSFGFQWIEGLAKQYLPKLCAFHYCCRISVQRKWSVGDDTPADCSLTIAIAKEKQIPTCILKRD